MVRYYYNKQKDRLYAYDNETGFYKAFDCFAGKWVTPVVSFTQVEHDNDIDFVEIPARKALEIAGGINFEREFQSYLAAINGRSDIS